MSQTTEQGADLGLASAPLFASCVHWLKKIFEPQSTRNTRNKKCGLRSTLVWNLLPLLLLAGMACGGGGSSPAPAPTPVVPVDILAALRATAGVATVTESASGLVDARFFVLTFLQPVDHNNPSGPTFPQTLTLLYRSRTAPTVLAATGYDIPRTPAQGEPARILAANQLQVEHRYFSASAPSPLDWRYLDILQAASDHHRITQAFRPLLSGKWLNTGGSKGGMTSIFHRRFFPNDVDATLAYVAPITYGQADPRYNPFVASRGTAATQAALRAWQQAVLDHRDEVGALLSSDAARRGQSLNALGLDRTLEFAVLESVFTLWQYGSAALAAQVPPPTASASALYTFLDTIYSGVVAQWDDATLAWYAPYYYQCATQLGYPDNDESYLAGLRYPRQDVPALYPPLGVTKVSDEAPMRDIQAWVSGSAERIIFIYGENDPWTAGAFDVPPAAQARDNHVYTVPAGNHGSRLAQLPEPQRSEAYALLARWMAAPVTPSIAPPAQPSAHETYLRPRGVGATPSR
jgi:hypothetical protein